MEAGSTDLNRPPPGPSLLLKNMVYGILIFETKKWIYIWDFNPPKIKKLEQNLANYEKVKKNQN